MKFTLPDQLPTNVAELEKLANLAKAQINVFQARFAQGEKDFTDEELTELEYLTESRDKLDQAIAAAAADEQSRTDRVTSAFEKAGGPTKPAEEPAEAKPDEPTVDAAPDAAADPEPAAEAASAKAAKEPVTAASPAPVSFAHAAPADTPVDHKPADREKRWDPLTSMPKYADFAGRKISTLEIAEAVSSVLPGERTGRQRTGTASREGVSFASQALARMPRPQGDVIQDEHQLFAELDRIAAEIPGRGKVSAKALVAAGGWCAPSEQLYDFCPTPAAANLLSLPEVTIKRGGIRFPAEPDFTALQIGFHFTEPELEAVDGQGEPTAIKNFVEIPCPDEQIEYRLEAIGWAVKAGILQRSAWPELIAKFMDEFLVAHQYRVSALTLTKMLATAGAAKVVPTEAVLGATTGVLNGLHVRARNLQLKTRVDTIEGVAPVWFRDVLRADLASRDGLDVLDVTDAQIDTWLAQRGIYLQYEGRWQSLTAGKPGDLDTAWWPGSVDVLLYPAGTFFRSLDNVITLGVEYPMDQVQKNRYTQGFVEDSFLVGKRCYPANLIRVPLCVNGAVGAREEIVCQPAQPAQPATLTKTVTVTGTGNWKADFATTAPSGDIAHNAAGTAVRSALAAIDDGLGASDFTVAGNGPYQITYPAKLGALTTDSTGLTGGTAAVS